MAIPAEFDYTSTTVLATLSTTITIDGVSYPVEAPGTRKGCDNVANEFDAVRSAEVSTLTSGIAFFSSDDFPLGQIRIFNDPRVSIPGKVIYAQEAPAEEPEDQPGDDPRDPRNPAGGGNVAVVSSIALALSSFYQVMVFHLIRGDDAPDVWLYGGAVWEVNAALTSFPPTHQNYYHAQTSSPLFDLQTGQANIAQKGISTIKLGAVATAAEAQSWQALYDAEVAAFDGLANRMATPSLAAYL